MLRSVPVKNGETQRLPLEKKEFSQFLDNLTYLLATESVSFEGKSSGGGAYYLGGSYPSDREFQGVVNGQLIRVMFDPTSGIDSWRRREGVFFEVFAGPDFGTGQLIDIYVLPGQEFYEPLKRILRMLRNEISPKELETIKAELGLSRKLQALVMSVATDPVPSKGMAEWLALLKERLVDLAGRMDSKDAKSGAMPKRMREEIRDELMALQKEIGERAPYHTCPFCRLNPVSPSGAEGHSGSGRRDIK